MKLKSFVLLMAFVLVTRFLFAVPVTGLVNTFEDGTFQGWNSGADLLNVATDGPAGVNDNYLEVSRTTFPFHIGIKNTDAWSGDFLAAGVERIELDANSIGPADISLRLMIMGPGGNFSTATPVPLITGGGWQHVSFSLKPSDLVHVTGSTSPNAPDGPGILSDTLSDIQTVLIRHDPGVNPQPPGTHPEHVFATIGFDNIEAVLGSAPSYEAAWFFDNNAATSYVLDSYEPNDIALGQPGTENPDLLLNLNQRYQVTVYNFNSHPFEVIAKAAAPGDDVVLLSAAPGVTGSMESDAGIQWVDNGSGTVEFTLTQELLDAMSPAGKVPGYRCAFHISTMRGDFIICSEPISGDLTNNCIVDLNDLIILSQDWLSNNRLP